MAEQRGSITLGVGQFCTNPGMIIAIGGEDLERFTGRLSQLIDETAPAKCFTVESVRHMLKKRDAFAGRCRNGGIELRST
jgi:NADP-dependent aldehyde dehydrogenase